jgi:uncharacterized protein YecT (DUF1311 family)
MRLPMIVCLMLATPAAAQTQSALNQSAGSTLAAADKTLNATYAKVMARLSPGGRTLLKTSQRAWLATRDADCAFVASAVEGGSLQPMIDADCRASETIARTKWLRRFVTCAEGDTACPS